MIYMYQTIMQKWHLTRRLLSIDLMVLILILAIHLCLSFSPDLSRNIVICSGLDLGCGSGEVILFRGYGISRLR